MFASINKRMQSLLERLVTVLFACLIILGGMQVFFRYVLGSSLVWSEEVSKIIFFYIIFLASSIALHHGAFASVDFLYRLFPGSLKRFLDILIWALIILFLGAVTILGGKITWMTMSQITPALEIPQAVVYFAVPFGSLLMGFPALHILLGLVAREKGESSC